MTNILDAYGEDGDNAYMNGSIGAGFAISTSAGEYRAAYSRCAIRCTPGQSSGTAFMQRLWLSGGLTEGWFSSRVYCNSSIDDVNFAMFGLTDPNGVLRIKIANNAGNANPSGPFAVYTVNSAGAAVKLGITSSGFSSAPTTPDKFDVNFDYSTTGFLTLYINGSQVFSYTGDITTDGQTELGGANLGAYGTAGCYCSWSECILADGDTRNMSMFTNAADAAGTVDNWTGEYTNVNGLAVNDADFDTTSTSGAVQRYKMGNIAAGNYVILAKVTSLRATKGAGGLSHLSLAELIGGAAHVTGPIEFPTAYGPAQFIQAVNPATGVAWTTADINAAARESGYEATT